MDRKFRDIVMTIAAEVRNWAEDKAQAEGRHHCLSGLCAIASAELYRKLTKAGIQAEIHMWYWDHDDCAHVYCVVDDYVVDVTASQFKEFWNTPVVLMHTKEAEAYDFYQTKEVFKDVKSLRREQKKNQWPPNQIALPA